MGPQPGEAPSLVPRATSEKFRWGYGDGRTYRLALAPRAVSPFHAAGEPGACRARRSAWWLPPPGDRTRPRISNQCPKGIVIPIVRGARCRYARLDGT